MCRSNKGITRTHLGINFWGETLEERAFLVADVDIKGLDREVRFLLFHAVSIDSFLVLSFSPESIGPRMEVPPPGCMVSFCAIILNARD
jgi:hypothetical protein